MAGSGSRQTSASASTAGESASLPKNVWLGFTFLMLSLLIVVLDLTVTDVVVPSIVTDLHIDANSATLIVTIYLVVAASFMVVMGKVVDAVGARKVLVASMVLFALGSLVTGSAPNFLILMVGRVLQGLVLATLAPASLTLLNLEFPAGPKRALAFSIWATVIGGAAALGPLIGGEAATAFSWRLAFYINVPIAIICVIGVSMFVVENRPDTSAKKGGAGQYDIVGTVLLILGIGTLVLGLQEGPKLGWWRAITTSSLLGWRPPGRLSIIPVLLILAVLALVVFALVENRRFRGGREVFLNPKLFKIASFTNGTLAASFITGSVFGLLLLVPLYSQYVLGYNPLQAGLTLLPLGLGMAVGGPFTPRLLRHFQARSLIIVGVIVQPIAVLLTVPLLSPNGSGWWLAPTLFLEGAAWSICYSGLVNILLFGVPSELSGVASGTQVSARLIAGGVCSALLTLVLTTVAVSSAQAKLTTVPSLSPQDRQQVEEAIHFQAEIHPKITSSNLTVTDLNQNRDFNAALKVVREAVAQAARLAVALAALFGAIAIYFAFRIPKPEPAG